MFPTIQKLLESVLLGAALRAISDAAWRELVPDPEVYA